MCGITAQSCAARKIISVRTSRTILICSEERKSRFENRVPGPTEDESQVAHEASLPKEDESQLAEQGLAATAR